MANLNELIVNGDAKINGTLCANSMLNYSNLTSGKAENDTNSHYIGVRNQNLSMYMVVNDGKTSSTSSDTRYIGLSTSSTFDGSNQFLTYGPESLGSTKYCVTIGKSPGQASKGIINHMYGALEQRRFNEAAVYRTSVYKDGTWEYLNSIDLRTNNDSTNYTRGVADYKINNITRDTHWIIQRTGAGTSTTTDKIAIGPDISSVANFSFGTGSLGSSRKPVYVNAGVLTACSSNIPAFYVKMFDLKVNSTTDIGASSTSTSTGDAYTDEITLSGYSPIAISSYYLTSKAYGVKYIGFRSAQSSSSTKFGSETITAVSSLAANAKYVSAAVQNTSSSTLTKGTTIGYISVLYVKN